MKVPREDFWPGFAVGAAAGTLLGIGAGLSWRSRISGVAPSVLRLEKSINIGRPVHTVFSSLLSLEELPRWIGFVKAVEQRGKRSRWVVEIDGRRIEWSARITQAVPNESIAWKSISGPRHTGRITFSPLEDQTVVHLVMNYAPRLRQLGLLRPLSQRLEHWIGRGLREFKAALEGDARKRGSSASGQGILRGYSARDAPERGRLRAAKHRAGLK
jgi:uncharacterized membrane protein